MNNVEATGTSLSERQALIPARQSPVAGYGETARYWLHWIAPLLFVLYLLPLGARPLAAPDEIRYAQISHEMVVSGDWVVPRLLGLRYFEKPVLGYWLNAASEIVFGHSGFAVRFASVLSAGLSALLVGLLAVRIGGNRAAGSAAATIYLSCILVYLLGTFSVLDSMLALSTTAAMGTFYYALQARDARRRLQRYALAGVCCGAGFLIKGGVALAVPVVSIALFMLWQRRWRELLLWGWVSVAVAAAVVAPWALAVQTREPDYWRYFIWVQHIHRFVADDAQHSAPLWFFVPVFIAGAMPWTFTLSTALRRIERQPSARRTDAIYFLLWIIMPLLFFSLSKGKLVTYILPCFAPLAIVLAQGLACGCDARRCPPLRWATWSSLALAGLLAAALIAVTTGAAKSAPLYSTAEWFKPVLLMATLIAWAGGAWCTRRQRGVNAVAALALAPALFMLILPIAAPASARLASTPESFITAETPRIAADAVLLSNNVGLATALAWQLSQSDIILYDHKGELRYGLAYPDASSRYVNQTAFPHWLQHTRAQHDVALFIRHDRTDHPAPQLPAPDYRAQAGRFQLYLYRRQP